MESFCYPSPLVNQLTAYDRWALGIELALGLNVALVVALLVYLMCQTSCRRGNQRRANYRNLISFNPHSNKSPSVQIDYSDKLQDAADASTTLLSDDEEI